MDQISTYLDSIEVPNTKTVFAVVFGLIGFASLNLFGFLQYFPFEFWVFFDAHFYSTYLSLFVLTFSGSALIARLWWFFLLRAMFVIGLFSIRMKGQNLYSKSARWHSRNIRRWLVRNRFDFWSSLFLLVVLRQLLFFKGNLGKGARWNLWFH